MLHRLALVIGSAFLATACVHSTGGRVQQLTTNVRTVTVAREVTVPRSSARSDVGQTLAKSQIGIEDIVRREFYVALKRGKYFPQVVGAVPVTPADSDWDLEATAGRNIRTSVPSADGFFQLKVRSYGYHSTIGFASSEARLKLEATLVDRAGNRLAWGQADSSGSTVPTRYPREFLGDARLTANDMSVAARVASERILEAMTRPGAARGRSTTTTTTTTTATTTTTSRR